MITHTSSFLLCLATSSTVYSADAVLPTGEDVEAEGDEGAET